MKCEWPSESVVQISLVEKDNNVCALCHMLFYTTCFRFGRLHWSLMNRDTKCLGYTCTDTDFFFFSCG